MNRGLSASICDALLTVAERLADDKASWLVGGSCGLLLQGVTVLKQPRDIDLYTNRETALAVHSRLRLYATEVPHYSETPIYRSMLSHYEVLGHKVELVGGFEVETLGSLYTVNVELLHRYAAVIQLRASSVPLMPLGHELLFNLLRNRPDRYEAIAAVMKREPDIHLPALQELLESGRWSGDIHCQLEALLKE